MPIHRFRNGTEAPLLVWVEPWCEEIEVPPGSTLVLATEMSSGEEEWAMIEAQDDCLVYWCGGDTYTAELDGKPLAP